MTASPAENLLSDAQLSQIDALLKELNHDQLLWLSGYIAALGRSDGQPPESKNEDNKVLIAYGTETGNSEGIASNLAFSFDQNKIPFDLKNLSQLRVRHLTKYRFIVMICSTHGDGDPPEPISLFYTSLMSAEAPRLMHSHYAVLALGDSSYPKFCATGKELDDRLSALGATRLVFRQDCDVDFQETAQKWSQELVRVLASRVEPVAKARSAPVESAKKTELNKNNPAHASVIDNVCLSSPSRPDVIHHIELTCDQRLTALQPGDAVGILVKNPEQDARRLIALTGGGADTVVQVNHRSIPLLQALVEECDITIPNKRLLVEWSKASGDSSIRQLLDDEGSALKDFLRSNQVIDIAERFQTAVAPQALVDALKPLQPRLYDVANCLRHTEDEIHILVKLHQYGFNGRLCTGAASDYLIHLKKDETIRLFPYRNARFQLPKDASAPIIFIAEGTGIAPFRAFLQALSLADNPPPCWLIFTEREFEEDFLYQTEWQAAIKSKQLTMLDAIFSNQTDGPSIKELLILKQQQLLRLLGQGAHLYLCGDKTLLGEIEKNLEALTLGSPEPWSALQAGARIHRNLY